MMQVLQNNSLNHLPQQLPVVHGKYVFDAMLAPFTWFQVGGLAQVLFKPHDSKDLANFIKNLTSDWQYFVLGAGSNVLIRDGGFDGVIIKLGRNFAQITLENDLLIAGAAALDRSVAMTALTHNLKGFEFLVTIPGSIGGAVAMNAGCYGSETKDILAWVECVDVTGQIVRLTASQLEMQYRKANLPKGYIITKAAFRAAPGNSAEIQHTIQKYLNLREESQPTKCRTGGSTFKNTSTYKAWELIDNAGCRGIAIGDAKISDKHCNFMLNTGKATAADLEDLGEMVKNKVSSNSNQNLEWEIIRIGKRLAK
jgi:UDP-N-acetylmuramate dehydrogenase